MSAKTSPFPWRVSTHNKAVIEDAEGYNVAQVSLYADAPLVAAAPDLLKALEDTIQGIELYGGVDFYCKTCTKIYREQS